MLAAIVLTLRDRYSKDREVTLIRQIANLRYRVHLICNMQIFVGALDLLLMDMEEGADMTHHL